MGWVGTKKRKRKSKKFLKYVYLIETKFHLYIFNSSYNERCYLNLPLLT